MALPIPSSVLLGGGLVLMLLTGFLIFLPSGKYQYGKDEITVAFVGNSFTFVNDLPRVLEVMSQGRIGHQDSCLHGALSVTSLLQRGNGMYQRWGNSSRREGGFPDFGACTVSQLLLGYDEELVNNYEDYYTNDGLNPCFQDPDYLEYSLAIRSLEEYQTSNNNYALDYNSRSYSGWDYVVINDQSMYPAVDYKRMKSASTLQEVYGPMLNASNAMPILYQTWAYWRDDIDMTDFVDIPTFTRSLQDGYEYYASILEEVLPNRLRPKIAPVGLAFLVLWEENKSFWDRLFGEDLFHPSPHGTYLAACVIYCTLFGQLPSASSRFTTDLFAQSRAMQISGEAQPLPTEEEALYLRWIAKRVALNGFIPKTLRKGNS